MTDTLAGLLVTMDGTVLRGFGGGAPGVAVGEMVFQTGMVGYQETLTDPSYAGQLLIFTYPLVGNYGAGEIARQSARVHATGVIARELMASSGHRAPTSSLDDLLREQGVPALFGVDTRFLTRKVRAHGVVPAAMAVAPEGDLPPIDDLVRRAQSLDYDAVDYVVGCTTPELRWYAPSRPGGP